MKPFWLPDTTGFSYREGKLFCEDASLEGIAERFGTPTYVYSRKALEKAYREYDDAFSGHPHEILYSVKACSNLAVIRVLANLGAGFDIVSGGELLRVEAAGGDLSKVTYSGVGKTDAEIRLALEKGIHCFNIESVSELDDIARIASELGKRAPVAVRVNPNVDAKTHPYISTGLKKNKFGVSYEETPALYRKAASLPSIEVIGIDCHIGSQITQLDPFGHAADKVLDVVEQLAADGIRLRHIDFGGGLGVCYKDEVPPEKAAFARVILDRLSSRGYGDLAVELEPGRSMVANAGVLLMRVIRCKAGEMKNFCIVDAAMNDMGRPMFYESWMGIVPACPRDGKGVTYDVVGPICESGDWLGRDRELNVLPGDLLAMTSAGAYGMTMSSNYNSRPRAAEVLVDGSSAFCVRRREEPSDLWRGESVPEELK
ncbi:MAG: diaminopimelate decarboxylase [Mesosutterella sp.]|nr:diaminopimelate decarboxylase [Mesosutterella sp.]